MRMCDLDVQSTVRLQKYSTVLYGYKNPGARTILMMKFASRALYAVPHVRVQSEVYFGL